MFVCPECGASQPNPGPCHADGTALVPVGDDLLLGTQIGAFRIARLLGIGGMGRVYKGVHPQIGSRVAIKVLSRECSDRRDLVERFFQEARAVNLIRHENIVNVLDLATLPDGRPFIIMEYLDGAPLASILEAAPQRGPLPLGGLARLAAEVLDALGAAHTKGIIHRDLKPDNIFITPQGRAKVLDFGIAKLQPELGGSATHTGSLLGTPHYMSPEQAAGRVVDARADLYAMGVILFECATLHKPFVADSLFELLRKHVEAPPPSPRALRPDMPPDLEHVISTALAKLPEQRFSSAQAMSAALQHATSQLPPEQWAPIQPHTTLSSGGWAPTPPASWARRAPQHPSTQTAGQVTTPERPGAMAPAGKGKGLWIALGAVVLVGGGITAALVAGGGSSGGASGGSDGGSASAIASGAAPGSAAPGPAAGSGSADVATAKPPPPPPAGGDDSDGDDDVTASIDEAIGEMPPEARKMLPSAIQAAIKKYGAWSKIPKAERDKLARAFAGGDLLGQVNGALGGGGGDGDTPPAGPPSFDPKKANVEAAVSWAIDQAKHRARDAQLVWISVDGVYPDGHADLTLKSFASDHGSIDVRFLSPSGAQPDPKLPRGVPQELKCMFRMSIEPGSGADLRDMSSTSGCKEQTVPKPRCTLKQVWQKALARRKDLGDAVAEITYTANIVSHKIVWMFDIHNVFSEQFADDC